MIDYKAPPTISRFMLSDALNRLLIGPFGSGKSTGSSVEFMRRMQGQSPNAKGVRRTKWFAVRNTYKELDDTTLPTMMSWIPSEVRRWMEGDKEFVIKFRDTPHTTVEAVIKLRALDRPEDVSKLLSTEYTGGWINEAREVPKAVFDALQGRIGRYPNSPEDGYCDWSGVWMDTNPPDSDHWLYKTFEEFDLIEPEDRGSFRVFHQPSGLAPDAENIENLLKGQRDIKGRPLYYSRMLPGKKKEWIDAYVHGLYAFVRDGRPVYGEFSDEVHVPKNDIPWNKGPLFLGMDFGLTPAIVVVQRAPDGQWQVIDEFTTERMGALGFSKEVSRELKSRYPGARYRGWGDPAGAQGAQTDEETPFEVVQSVGLPIDPAPTNDFIRRREAVATNLTTLTMSARPALVISPKCKKLRRAMNGGYHFKRVQVSGTERYQDSPVKDDYSHIAEALQYQQVGEGQDNSALNGSAQDQNESRDNYPVPTVKTAVGRSSHAANRNRQAR